MTRQSPPRVDHWPPALRSAAVLTGTLVRSGPGYRPVSWPDNAVARCTTIAGLLTDRFAAIEGTAAWIWGVSRSPGTPLRLLARRGRTPARFDPVSADTDVHVSRYRLAPGDVVELAGYGVTTRLRTLYDLLRAPQAMQREHLIACRLLLFTEPEARERLARRAESASRADRSRIERRRHTIAPPPRGPASKR